MTQRLVSEPGEVAGLQSPQSRHRPKRRHGIQGFVAVETGRVIGPLDQ